MSINALQHHEQGRRDDLEALSYLFLYLHVGHLPWQGLPGSTFAEKCKRILEKKLKLGIEDVCQGAPVEFSKFMKYARTLEYEDKPDYIFCRQLFKDMMTKEGVVFDHAYDWNGEKAVDFWKSRHKLLGSLGPLPEDLQVSKISDNCIILAELFIDILILLDTDQVGREVRWGEFGRWSQVEKRGGGFVAQRPQ